MALDECVEREGVNARASCDLRGGFTGGADGIIQRQPAVAGRVSDGHEGGSGSWLAAPS